MDINVKNHQFNDLPKNYLPYINFIQQFFDNLISIDVLSFLFLEDHLTGWVIVSGLGLDVSLGFVHLWIQNLVLFPLG